MTRDKQLKTLYTVGAVALAGLLSLGVVPAQVHDQANMALMYLLMHSWLPSAKKPGQQG